MTAAMLLRWPLLALAGASLLPPLAPASAQQVERAWDWTLNDFGGTGLLQMPNARFADDGEIQFGYSHVWPYGRYFITAQALPWLEASFRYTDIENKPYRSSAGKQSFKDRGIDLRFRLVEEGELTPQIALGLRDWGGTSLFGSEYLALSRRWYDFDFTWGVAWGNIGSRGGLRNPLTLLSNRFKSNKRSGGTGNLSPGLFGGDEIGFFGGVEWMTPIDGLRVKVEYDGNDYQHEPLGNRLDVASPINVGLQYSPYAWLDLALAFERGNELMLRGSIRFNAHTDKGPTKTDPPLPRLQARAEPAPQAGGLPAITAVPTPQPVAETLRGNGIPVADYAAAEGIATIRLAGDAPLPHPADMAQAALHVIRREARPITRVVFRVEDGDQVLAQLDYAREPLERSAALTGTAYALLPPVDPAWARFAADRGVAEPGWGERRVIAAPQPAPPPSHDAATRRGVAEKIFADLEPQGFRGLAFALEGHAAVLHFSQTKYRNPAKALGRAGRVVAAHAPAQIEEIVLVLMNDGVPISQTTLLRRDLDRAARLMSSPEETWQNVRLEPALGPAADAVRAADAYPSLNWSVAPKFRQHIGGPDSFIFYQIYANASAQVEIMRGLTLGGSLGADIYNNFDNLVQDSNSTLPHVRSDIKDYLKGTRVWLDELHLDYVFNPAPQWYAYGSVGLMEMMFGGVAGEILYRPAGQRWAVGLDLAHVWQRDTSGLFGFRNYDVTTGHGTLYYELPWYQLDTSVSFGRYLARDLGATLTFSRTFDSGITAGIWATKTNVSAATFGEGSFDKGFFISLPLDLFGTTSGKQRTAFAFRPVSRDAGQKLAMPRSLYAITQGEGYGAITEGWGEFGR